MHNLGLGWSRHPYAPIVVLAVAFAVCHAAPSRPACQRVQLQGEVNSGQEWRAPLGQGWLFRVLPIAPSPAGYSGWDLAVDRDPPAGYPDALLLATLPYNSINQREIGTTFGLRAQDAIGWNPRSFRFFSNRGEFRQAQISFRQLTPSTGEKSLADNPARTGAMQRLLQLQSRAAIGQFRIVDARIVPGTADPRPFAQSWALAYSRSQHQIQSAPPGQQSAGGTLLWMRFEVTLWLPLPWSLPPSLHAARMSCPE